ncbi:MAG: HRDC domain-containing protein [Desulfobacterales bacterium]|nr:HRDC domain-containing protein [Desulfobacterales bacterium]
MDYQFITSDEALKSICSELGREKIIAVDLEADSMHSFTEKICLIQIAGARQAYLVDPFLITDFSPFSRILEAPDIIKVFHGSDFDVRSLDRELSVEIQNLFDTEIACRFLNVKERGLGALLKAHFNVHVDKRFQKVDWSRRPLKEDMIAYSVGDVANLIELHDLLRDQLDNMGRLAWAREEFELQTRVKYEANHQPPLFKRFKGAGKMDNRTLAVLEGLLRLRVDLARKKDLPLFKIMSNQSIMGMALERPRGIKNIIDSRLLSKKQAGMYGARCLEAIKTAMALSHGELPSYPRTRMPRKNPRVLERITRLKKMRERCSVSIGMEPGFLINNNLITAVAFANPGDRDALLDIDSMRHWQVDALGDHILTALNGCA